MQLIAEAYDVLRSVGGLSNAELADIVRGVERGRAAVVPDRDHRARSSARRIPRRAATLRRSDPGRGGDEGHRQVDGAGRRGARRARCRPSRRRVEARVLSSEQRRARGGRRRSCAGPTPPLAAGDRQEAARRRRARTRSTRRRLLLRAGHEPAPRARRGAAGASSSASSRASGRAAASSARSSSAASRPRTSATPTLPNLLLDAEFREELAERQDGWRRVVARRPAGSRC